MSSRRLFQLVFGLMLILLFLAGCNVSIAESTPLPQTAEPTAKVEPTATLPPLQVSEMSGVTVRSLCLEVEEYYPQISEEFSTHLPLHISGILSNMGFQIVGPGQPCDAALTFHITAEFISGAYQIFGECFTAYSGDIYVTLVSQRNAQEFVTGHDFRTEPAGAVVEGYCYKDASDAAIALMGKDDQGKYEAAFVNVLVELWGPRALIPVLGWNTYATPATAILVESGSLFVPELSRVLDDDDRNTQQQAALALGMIGPEAEQAIPALIELAEGCNDPARCTNVYTVALEEITGLDLGRNADTWRYWWGKQQK